MVNQSRLISGGVNYYIEGGSKYTGSGTPWTVVGTSPYAMAMNDTAGTSYTPMAATRQEVYGGGPPFRNGQTLIYNSYGNVTESVTIQCRANTHDNAVFLLRQLRQILNTALFSTPCQLAYQPDGAANAVYFEIYGADVQEDQRFVNSEAKAASSGNALVRAVVTWRRSAFGGLLSAGETLLNAAALRDTGTGSPDNVEAYSTGAGEMIYEGSPLNLKFTPTTAASDPSIIYLASVLSRTYTTTGVGSSTTASSSYQLVGTGTTIAAAALMTGRGLKARIIGRFSAMSTNAELRINYGISGTQVTRPVIPGNTVATLVDFGVISLASLDRASVTANEDIPVVVQARSTNGAAISVTLTYLELLLYYDFCRIKTIGNEIDVSASQYLYLDSYVEKANYAALPRSPARAWVYSSADALTLPCEIRGTPPRYFSGASLYVAWYDPSIAHATTMAATITAKHAPLFKTLRGAG